MTLDWSVVVMGCQTSAVLVFELVHQHNFDGVLFPDD